MADVFCKKCIYLIHDLSGLYECKNWNNIKSKTVLNTFYEQKVKTIYKRTPQKINKHNKCKWYLDSYLDAYLDDSNEMK